MDFLYFSLAVFVFIVLNIVFVIKGNFKLANIFKVIGMIFVVIAGGWAVQITGNVLFNILIVLGLTFSLMFDVVLCARDVLEENKNTLLNVALVGVSLSSVLYIISTTLIWYELKHFWITFAGALVLGIIFAVLTLLFEKKLKLNYKGYKVSLAIASFAVSASVVLSLIISFFVPGFALFAVGNLLVAVAFYVKTFIFFKEGNESKILYTISNITYFIGNLLIVAFLFFQLI